MRALVEKLSAVQEAVLITAICAGWFIFSAISVVLAGFPLLAGGGYNDAAAFSLIVFECIAFCAAFVVLRWRGWQLQDFLFSLTWRDVLAAVVLLVASAVVNAVIWSAFTSSFDDGSVLKAVVQPGGVSFGAALLMSAVNGTFEEFFLCRYLIERFRGSGAAFAVGLSAGIRMLYHVYQGPHGTLFVLAFGLMLGAYYWRTRSFGAVALTHVAADLIALT